MKLFLVESNDSLAEVVGGIARSVGGIEVRTLASAPSEHEFAAAAVDLICVFGPDLVILLSWKDHGEAVLARIRDLCDEIWVMTAYPARGRVHHEAMEADLVLSSDLVTQAVLGALLQRAKQKWESRQPIAAG